MFFGDYTDIELFELLAMDANPLWETLNLKGL